MDQVTQQNAALVEEASAAAQSMREQASSLVDAVSVFKLEVDDEAARAISQARAGSQPALAAPAKAKTLPRPAAARPAALQKRTAELATAGDGAGDWKEF
jgi:methyl-accepting chemotaxis protein